MWVVGMRYLTGVSIGEVGLAGVKSGVYGWQDAAVEGLGAVQEILVLGRVVVVV